MTSGAIPSSRSRACGVRLDLTFGNISYFELIRIVMVSRLIT